ncbi:MAG TPA: hypothetical protein VGJ93_00940 [Desulfuromonadaceae bacterium]|jgi:hypothetical protein
MVCLDHSCNGSHRIRLTSINYAVACKDNYSNTKCREYGEKVPDNENKEGGGYKEEMLRFGNIHGHLARGALKTALEAARAEQICSTLLIFFINISVRLSVLGFIFLAETAEAGTPPLPFLFGVR